MAQFTYDPHPQLPFRDKAVIERVRNIKREDIEKHPNPDFHIRVVPDDMVEWIFVADMFQRIWRSAETGEKVVLILPNPCHAYKKVAYLINKFRVNCANVHCFAMDEFADQDGNIAPEDFPQGFTRAMKAYFYAEIDPDLRMPETQVVGFTNRNIADYGKMITDLGGADACYSGSGWAGHIAFIDPDAPEFAGSLAEWKQMGPRVVSLHLLTVAQNSLHYSFGASGDIAAVPPKAATIGPAQVIESKFRHDTNALTTAGTDVSWQRFITRLVAHGPVTPQVPTSILQEVGADFYISETCAQNIEPKWHRGY